MHFYDLSYQQKSQPMPQIQPFIGTLHVMRFFLQFPQFFGRQSHAIICDYYEDQNSLTAIASYAFAGIPALRSVSMPYLTAVPEQCFTDDTSLEEINLPEVLAANLRSFAYLTIEAITLPKCSIMNGSANIYACQSLKEIRLPANTSNLASFLSSSQTVELLDAGVTAALGTDFTQGVYANLRYLILRNTSQVCTAASAVMFRSGSPLKEGAGLVLVPSPLVDSYKADSRWGSYASMIAAIEDYPDICG